MDHGGRLDEPRPLAARLRPGRRGPRRGRGGGDLTGLWDAIAATWPAARTAAAGGFTLRDGAGGGSRASSTRLAAPWPEADPEAALAALGAKGWPVLFLVREGEDALGAALARMGLVARDPSVIYRAEAAALGRPEGAMTVIDCEAPLARLVEIWEAGGIGPARRAVMARVAGPRRYLLGRLDDRVAGAGFVAVHGTHAVASALLVAPEARRRGLGAELVRAAAAWGRAAGATHLALAVEEGNAPARALYERLGMGVAARYHYRAPRQEEPR